MSSQSNNLKKLKDEWYKKLADEGFEDIEQDDGKLKTWSSRFYLNHHKDSNHTTNYEDFILTNSAKEQYYRLAEHFLNTHKFKSDFERQIWQFHSEGLSYREITKLLKPRVSIVVNKDKVNGIIKRLSKAMIEWAKNEELKKG